MGPSSSSRLARYDSPAVVSRRLGSSAFSLWVIGICEALSMEANRMYGGSAVTREKSRSSERARMFNDHMVYFYIAVFRILMEILCYLCAVRWVHSQS